MDAPLWIDLGYELGREIALPVRKALAAAPSLLRLYWGERTALGAALDDCKEAVDRQAERERERHGPPSDEEARPSPSQRQRGRETSATGPINRLGIVGGLVFRGAERAERGLLSALRGPLHLFLPSMPAIRQLHTLEQYGELKQELRETIVSDGLVGIGSAHEILRAIAEDERLGTPCEPLSKSCEAAEAIIDARLADPGLPQRVQDTYAAFEWRGAAEKKTGHLRIDDGKTVVTFRYGPQCRYLGLLDLASRMIASRYRWSVESGLAFLLCGTPQALKVARVDYQMDSDPSVLSRIVLTIDPSMSPNEVRSLYAHARRRIVEKYREVSPAQMDLASFVFSQTHTPLTLDGTIEAEAVPEDRCALDRSWDRLMACWNRRRESSLIRGQAGKPKLYSEAWRFRNRAEDALRRLLNPQYQKPQHSTEYPSLEEFEDERRLWLNDQ